MTSVSDPEEVVLALCREMMESYQRGKIGEAVDAGERARIVAVKIWGDRDLRFAEISHNLGELFRLRGRFNDAMVAARRALDVREALLDSHDTRIGNSLETIAKIQEQTEDLQGAADTYDRVLAIRRAHRDSAELQLAETLGNSGVLYKRLDNPREAIRRIHEAREIFVRHGATKEWSYAAALTNEASALRDLEKWEEAETLYGEALGSYEKDDTRSASVLANLAELYREQGKLDRAEEMHRLLDRIEAEHGLVVHDLNIASGNRGLLYGDQGRYAEAQEQLLKSAAFDDELLADVFEAASPAHKLAQARAIQGHVYALLSLLRAHFADSADLAATLVLRRKALVQDAIARGRSSLLRRATRAKDKIDVHTLRSVLPAGSVLIDYFKYAPYQFGNYPARGQSRWGPPRYLAIVIPADSSRAIQLSDLGPASAVDELVSGLKHQLAYGRDVDVPASTNAIDLTGATEALRRATFDPLADALRGARHLFIAPDGELSLVPFGIFRLDRGRHLIDDCVITYLTSGRDVLRFHEASSAIGPAVVIADPDYDLKATTAAAAGRSRHSHHGRLNLRRLPGTRAEGIAIGKLLGVAPLLDAHAVERTLKQARRPRIVHIATHGFFLSGAGDPMRRSGLALAGANTWSNGGDVPPEAEDGVLHAEDVSELDLEGSELVVLSACDTARGEVQSGEGVFGLRRAFVLAGARTVVMSLWKVDDSRTKDLMEKFYERIPRVGGHAEALRCAQLWLKKAHPSPTLWGAFICQSDVGSGATGDRLACPDD